MSILEFVNREGSPLFHLEHYIEGNYIKYNSNAGFVEDMHVRYTPHAFSHFSFECSNHELIIVDIQVNLMATSMIKFETNSLTIKYFFQGVGDLYTGRCRIFNLILLRLSYKLR